MEMLFGWERVESSEILKYGAALENSNWYVLVPPPQPHLQWSILYHQKRGILYLVDDWNGGCRFNSESQKDLCPGNCCFHVVIPSFQFHPSRISHFWQGWKTEGSMEDLQMEDQQ